jgi:hypothetical protein
MLTLYKFLITFFIFPHLDLYVSVFYCASATSEAAFVSPKNSQLNQLILFEELIHSIANITLQGLFENLYFDF